MTAGGRWSGPSGLGPKGDPWLADAQPDRFAHSSGALFASNAASGVLGVAFWAVAAHLYPAQLVGYGAAEIAAMTLLGGIALLNLGTVFPRFLIPAGSRAGIVLGAGYGASMSIALVAGILFLTVTGYHGYLPAGTPSGIFFLGAVVLWVVFTIEDGALVGFRRTFWVPAENISFSIGKIALLPVFAALAPRAGVFDSWSRSSRVCSS